MLAIGTQTDATFSLTWRQTHRCSERIELRPAAWNWFGFVFSTDAVVCVSHQISVRSQKPKKERESRFEVERTTCTWIYAVLHTCSLSTRLSLKAAGFMMQHLMLIWLWRSNRRSRDPMRNVGRLHKNMHLNANLGARWNSNSLPRLGLLMRSCQDCPKSLSRFKAEEKLTLWAARSWKQRADPTVGLMSRSKVESSFNRSKISSLWHH